MSANYNTWLILVVGTVLTFLLGRLTVKLNRKTAESDDKEKRIVELERKQAVLEAQAEPINATYLAMSIAKLTHLHTPRMDELLVKIGPPSTITPEEMIELELGLKQRMVDMSEEIDDEERLRAEILLNLIKLEIIEASKATSNKPMEVVSVTKPVEVVIDGKEEPIENAEK